MCALPNFRRDRCRYGGIKNVHCVPLMALFFRWRKTTGGFVMNLRNNKVEPLSGGWRVWLCGLSAVFILTLLCSTARADIVTDWNVTTNALVANDVGNNPRLRTLAMVHVAMSDAINTVQNRYTRVVATHAPAPGPSADFAVASAARH